MGNGFYTYMLEMQTLLGIRRGSLLLNLENQSMEGNLTMFTRTTPIQDGHRCRSYIAFRGEMNTTAGAIPYLAAGEMHRDTLELDISTQWGRYPVRGISVKKKRS